MKSFFLIIFILSNALFAQSNWEELEVSNENKISLENAVRLSTFVLGAPNLLELKAEAKCEQERAKEIHERICTEENKKPIQDLQGFNNTKEKSTLRQAVSRVRSSHAILLNDPNWKLKTKSCNKEYDLKIKLSNNFTAWVNSLSASQLSSLTRFNQSFKQEYMRSFKISDEEYANFENWCLGNGEIPTSNQMLISIATSNFHSSKMKEVIRKLCREFSEGTMTSELLKEKFYEISINSDIIKSSFDIARDNMFKSKRYKISKLKKPMQKLFLSSFKPNFFTPSVSKESFPEGLIQKEINKISGNECLNYKTNPINQNITRYCVCYEREIKKTYAKLISKDLDPPISELNETINTVYRLMVEKSSFSDSDKKQILKTSPAPKVTIKHSDNWNAHYSSKGRVIPFSPEILLSPAIISHFDDPAYRDYILGVIMHELGHHYFNSLFKSETLENLSDESREKLTEFSNCVDQTTIEREIIPGLKGQLLFGPTCGHVAKKRPELAADFFSIIANDSSFDKIGTWDSEKHASFLCSAKWSKDKSRLDENRSHYFKGSHTEPISRAEIILDPPICVKSLWP